jgi:hypothetical protein
MGRRVIWANRYRNRAAYLRAYSLARWHRRRRIALRFLAMLAGGGPPACAVCGDDAGPFEIDHVEAEAKTMNVSAALTRSIRTLWAELRRCWLLCQGCHYSKTAADGAKLEWWRTLRKPANYVEDDGEPVPF